MFWKPGTAAPGLEFDKNPVDGEEQPIIFNKYQKLSINQQRARLPIFKYKTSFLYLLENYPVIVIVGSTGCGKSTQLPQYLDEAGWTVGGRMVGCTQPRRVAATSLAQRVAEEMGTVAGMEVGYAIRFTDCTDPFLTRIKYMTDGMLLREMMIDPLLTRYSVIILDEAHERSLHTDVLLGLLKKVQKKRPDLRLVIASATIDAQEFKDFFNGRNTINKDLPESVSIMSIEGRQFDVEILYYHEPVSNYATSAVETAWDIHCMEAEGNILIFLTGQEEIDYVAELLQEKFGVEKGRKKNIKNMHILTLYSALPMEKQMQVFQKAGANTRKVIISTNIAETSVTIDDIVFVIDCGFTKIRTYNANTDTESLVVVPVSQSSANQRAGRAGRLKNGKCYRLYTEDAFYGLKVKNIPEMQRSSLSSVILQLKTMGIENVLQFDFMSSPPASSMIRALEQLYALGALDDNANLTSPLGTNMADIPLAPSLAKMLLASDEYECSEEILSIAAMLSLQSIFINNKALKERRVFFQVHEGDQLTLLSIYNGYINSKLDGKTWCHSNQINYKAMLRATDIRNQLIKYLKKSGIQQLKSAKGQTERIQKAILAGFFMNAAQLQQDGTYKTLRSSYKLSIHPSSVLFKEIPPPWIVFHEVIQTNKEYMKDCTMIESKWLTEVAPHFYDLKQTKLNQIAYDPTTDFNF
jgi:ATP-dependent RNA helicase DDX35